MLLRLNNTLTGKKQEFIPINKNTVGLYSCGPTVYHFAHIGNMRTYLSVDILKRTLTYFGYTVNHVMNITDVGHLTDDADSGEDKMEKGSRREGKTAWDIAQIYTHAFLEDAKSLNFIPPTVLAKATDHIKEQIDQVISLQKNGYTYETPDGIYFDTSKKQDYGEMAHLKKQSLKAGARVHMGYKKNIHDFALWKFSNPNEKRQMEWDAFGRKGFPGWHIECSAMSMKYLGEHFDIHAGGIDLIPVHHVNEIAQAESITQKKPWVNYWVHGAHVLMFGEKLAKSKGDFVTIRTIREKNMDPLAFRYLCLLTHYRKELHFTWEGLEAAEEGLLGLKKSINTLKKQPETEHADSKKEIEKTNAYIETFKKALAEDLNTAKAVATLREMLKDTGMNPKTKYETAREFDTVLGLSLFENEKHENSNERIPEKIRVLAEKRFKLKQEKKWTESDAVRSQILSLGYGIEDTPEGYHIKKT